MSYEVTNGNTTITVDNCPSAIQAACSALHGQVLEDLDEYTYITEWGVQPTKIATSYLMNGAQPFRDLLERVR